MIELSSLQCDDDMETHFSLFLNFAKLPPRRSFSTALLLIILFPLAALSLCYFPDGRPAIDDVPCNPSWAQSACCGEGWDCLGNGTVCIPNKDDPGAVAFIARGSCTDSTFESSGCPPFCIGKSTCFISFYPILLSSTPGKRLTGSTCTSRYVARNSSNPQRERMSASRSRRRLDVQ